MLLAHAELILGRLQVLDFEQWFTSLYASGDDAAAAPAVGPDGEPLDDGEAFEMQQMERVIAEDPESLAFHNARKVLAASKVRCLKHNV